MPDKLPTLMTELEAVNIMLSKIGEAPLSNLDGQVNYDAVVARQTLHSVSREVQEEGWHFNSEKEYPLALGVDGTITVPPSFLRLEVNKVRHPRANLTIRAGKLYDLDNHTFVFTATVYVDLVWMFDFNDIPPVARTYITIRAARQFANSNLTSETINGFASVDEARARAALVNDNLRRDRYNVFNAIRRTDRRWHRS